jgi:acetoacetyl-CoA reductase
MSKLAIVTGGIRGIGAAISIALHHQGYKVVASFISNEEKAQIFLKKYNIPVKKFDVTDIDACQKAIRAIEEEYNDHVSILVNNDGITRDSMLHKISSQKWQEVIETNLTSCFNMSHIVVKKMRENNFGRIINISSINALAGQIGQTNYSASKAGIIGFTKALALESASKNITVNAVAPGYIETDMTKEVPENIIKQIKDQIPVKRFGKPEEIARVVLFLAAEEAGFITGETISVNGGHYMN